MLAHEVSQVKPNTIVIEVENRYTPRNLGGEKSVKSSVVIELDENGRIKKVQDK